MENRDVILTLELSVTAEEFLDEFNYDVDQDDQTSDLDYAMSILNRELARGQDDLTDLLDEIKHALAYFYHMSDDAKRTMFNRIKKLKCISVRAL